VPTGNIVLIVVLVFVVQAGLIGRTRGEDLVGKILTLRVSSTSRSTRTSTSRRITDFATSSSYLKANPPGGHFPESICRFKTL
jgi:hypothetical protein